MPPNKTRHLPMKTVQTHGTGHAGQHIIEQHICKYSWKWAGFLCELEQMSQWGKPAHIHLQLCRFKLMAQDMLDNTSLNSTTPASTGELGSYVNWSRWVSEGNLPTPSCSCAGLAVCCSLSSLCQMNFLFVSVTAGKTKTYKKTWKRASVKTNRYYLLISNFGTMADFLTTFMYICILQNNCN